MSLGCSAWVLLDLEGGGGTPVKFPDTQFAFPNITHAVWCKAEDKPNCLSVYLFVLQLYWILAVAIIFLIRFRNKISIRYCLQSSTSSSVVVLCFPITFHSRENQFQNSHASKIAASWVEELRLSDENVRRPPKGLRRYFYSYLNDRVTDIYYSHFTENKIRIWDK